MPISYTIDEKAGVIHEVWVGEINAIELERYWKNYLMDPRVLELRRTLADLRAATIHIKGTELSALITDIVLPILKERKWKTAILVERPDQFGLSRQYQVFAELYSHDAIFSDRDQALYWLLDERESPASEFL